MIAFNAISKGTGKITEENLKCTFGASRESDPENFDHFCRNMISNYDTDLDDTLTLEEFKKIIHDFEKSTENANNANAN